MTNKIFILIFCLIYSLKVVSAQNLPKWMTNLDEFCGKENLCATGSGNSLNLAKSNARNNMLKIFETKISSKFSNVLSNSNDNIRENTYEEINDEVSGILNGVSITKTFENNGKIYVLATLNKDQVSKQIAKDIDFLDNKMKTLLNNDSYASAIELEDLYQKRESLNNKYLFLSNKNKKELISYSQVIENKNKKKNKLPPYLIKIKKGDDSIASIVIDILVKNGINVTKKENSANKIVTIEMNMNKEYMNVEGFEKYRINLNLDISKNGIITGFIEMEFIETGRNKDQIYDKSLQRIREYIEENFDEFVN